MNKELIIRSSSNAVDFALLKEGKLIELHKESSDNNIAVGDIYLAKVRKALSGLNAAFVNVGYEKDGFLHYHDLGPQIKTSLKFVKKAGSPKFKDYTFKNFDFEEDIDKDGSITNVLNPNQSILVQVVKEPISSKGPRLSSELSLAGRYIVLVPFSNRVSVSQKIEDKEEKNRLKRLVKSIKPKGFSVIIRTVAEGKKVADIDRDLQNLLSRWQTMCKKIQRVQPPNKVLGELNKASSMLRDLFNDSFTSIIVDDENLFSQIKDYVGEISPEKESIVSYYNSKVPMYEKYNVERQIKTSFGETVTMKKGAYLVIEHTEAMHVIDVNSGNRSNKAKNQADTALEVNLISATEIARQLRLRDMGGIIVVDFIDMVNSDHRKKLYDHLRSEMNDDRAKHKILPPSKFGLIQITRQRVRPELAIKTREQNPNRNGEIEAPIVIINKLNTDLQKIITKGYKKVTLTAHPFVAAYLVKGTPSMRTKWFLDFKKWVKIQPRDAHQYLEYHFIDQEGNPINI
ncbi:MAG: Rne/Rng family ribonuclease [Psychroflexus sp.]|nr:Rne/Rng family ribonuclease [Psychroflexus sp.]MDN6309177.1 Rne/Rng family ribonuclease [Psychroflexus sp.]